jgi:hypothetical protein
MLSESANYPPMSSSKPLVNICRYLVKPGKQAEMEGLLARHWPTLHAAGLVTDQKAIIYRGLPSGKPGGEHGADRTYLEILVWRDAKGPELAHQTPEVMAVWEPMGAICEQMEFPSFELLVLPHSGE